MVALGKKELEPAESKRPTVLVPKDKNKDRGDPVMQKRLGVLEALAKSMAKARI